MPLLRPRAHRTRPSVRSARLRRTAVIVVACAAALAPALTAAPAHAGKTPLPTPSATVDPRTAVGGPELARMDVIVDAPDGVPAPPKMPNVAWLLADMETGEVLAAKAPHAQLRPASTLKMLTALTLIPQIPANSKHKVTKADASVVGSRVGLVPGQTYTGQDLFNALLMASGNDAAYALTRVNGGREKTIAAMQAKADALGAFDTTPKDPAGLDVKGQFSSAYDLALIARAAMENEAFREYVHRKRTTIPGYGSDEFQISNHNKLLYNYKGTLGVKSGYTIKAEHTLVTAVRRDGRTYLVTQMHGTTNSWRPTAALYDWAFRHGDEVTPVGHLVAPGEATDPALVPEPSPSVTGEEASGQPVAAGAAVPPNGTDWLDLAVGAVGLLGCLGLILVLRDRAHAPAGGARHRH